MPGLNLTRNEAIERASIIKRVHSYRIELDLPKDKDVFSSKVEIRFDAQEGASTFIDAITSSVKSINLNGEELSTDLADGERIQLPNLAAENTLVIDTEMFLAPTPVRVCTVSWTPPTAKCTCTPSLRCRTPAACSPSLSSPT